MGQTERTPEVGYQYGIQVMDKSPEKKQGRD